uniref:Ankyrin repeat domain-containing protein n=1 Tax=Timema bartmani TaxID=61472 RepID=A0A7R9F429_9NEOP|nr:unnamed protein product [Timema bartmani]
MQAARNGQSTVAIKLLNNGVNVNLKNKLGANLLTLAVASNDEATITAVINDMSHKIVDLSLDPLPLAIASLQGFNNVVTTLLKKGFNPNTATSCTGQVPVVSSITAIGIPGSYPRPSAGIFRIPRNKSNKCEIDHVQDDTTVLSTSKPVLNLDSFLLKLGLQEYIPIFTKQEITLSTNEDLHDPIANEAAKKEDSESGDSSGGWREDKRKKYLTAPGQNSNLEFFIGNPDKTDALMNILSGGDGLKMSGSMSTNFRLLMFI